MTDTIERDLVAFLKGESLVERLGSQVLCTQVFSASALSQGYKPFYAAAVVTRLSTLTEVLGLGWGGDYVDRDVLVLVSTAAKVELLGLTKCLVDVGELVVPTDSSGSNMCPGQWHAPVFAQDGRTVGTAVITYDTEYLIVDDLNVCVPLSIRPSHLEELYVETERLVATVMVVKEVTGVAP